MELTLPRSGQTLPRPRCSNDPSHPFPKREGPFSLFGFANFPRRAVCKSGRATAHPEARCTPDGTVRPRVFRTLGWR